MILSAIDSSPRPFNLSSNTMLQTRKERKRKRKKNKREEDRERKYFQKVHVSFIMYT